MNKDLENSDSFHNSQASQDSSPEDIVLADKESVLEESKISEATDSENLAGENPVTEKQSPRGKGRLFLIIIIITLSTGGYFYFQKKGINLAVVSLGLNKFFPETAMLSQSLTVPPKTLSLQSDSTTMKQIAELGTIENLNYENETTINLLRNEIKLLKDELAKKNNLPILQNLRHTMPHISGVSVGEVSNELIKEKTALGVEAQASSIAAQPVENKEPLPETQTSSITVPPTESKLVSNQNQFKEISPKRSKEVQAYLNFIENTGRKILYLIKE